MAELPPAATPDPSPPVTAEPAGRVVPLDQAPEIAPPGPVAVGDGLVAVVSRRERALELRDARSGERVARAPAGAGPTTVVAGATRIYVVDTTGDGLLVFRWKPELALDRRVALIGAPYGLAVDPARARLWATLTATNELIELSAGSRPRVLRTLPAVRQPNRVAVAPGGRVVVWGADAAQLLDLTR